MTVWWHNIIFIRGWWAHISESTRARTFRLNIHCYSLKKKTMLGHTLSYSSIGLPHQTVAALMFLLPPCMPRVCLAWLQKFFFVHHPSSYICFSWLLPYMWAGCCRHSKPFAAQLCFNSNLDPTMQPKPKWSKTDFNVKGTANPNTASKNSENPAHLF